MRILVVGSNGQLGADMVAVLTAAGHGVHAFDIPEIDITSRPSVDRIIGRARPEVIVNCAGYTAVDTCESNEADAYAVNAEGVEHLARAADEVGSSLVHFSTDYVFDGSRGTAYAESDAPHPLSVYGRSKLAGEQRLAAALQQHCIMRISWLYGMHGKNFVKSIRAAGASRLSAGEPLRVVNDQIGSPTYGVDVCRQVLALLGTSHVGIFHCTSEGSCSWYEFAGRILHAAGIPVKLEPCTTAQYPLPAARPAYSVLENRRLKALGLNRMPHWKEAFERFCADEQRGGPA